MSDAKNGRQPTEYRVVVLFPARQNLEAKLLEAGSLERAHAILDAFRQAVQRLRREPLIFGEPHYRLTGLMLQVRQGVIHPLVVDYAVHEAQPLVFIRGFKVLS